MIELVNYTPLSSSENLLLPAPSFELVRELRRVRRNNRRARKRGRLATLKLYEWLTVLERYDRKCAYCGDAFNSMDHIVPIKHGGGTVLGTVLPSCERCNQSRDVLEEMYWQMKAYEKAIEMGEAAGLFG